MSWTIGEKLKITVFGQSHSEAIGVVIDGFPSGVTVNVDKLESFMKRRAPGQAFSTPRKEADKVEFLSGLNVDGKTCGSPIVAIIRNTNVQSKDYDNIKLLPRPSHSDLVSLLKFGEGRDIRGGGQFSGRLTAPLCIAGALCLDLLESKGVKIGAHIYSVGNSFDLPYDKVDEIIPNNQVDFPAIDKNQSAKMQEEILSVMKEGDSIGASIECKIVGVPATIGEPMFDGIENCLAKAMFGIPAVKGFEVGAGFDVCKKKGSENNDELTVKEGKITTVTNNDGGINGGITNGMPITFRVAIKPTPSIAKAQQSVNVESMEEETLEIRGRHDPCIAVRAVPVVEAVSAIVFANLLI
ncbi:MAG: chorismate synthase [Clostridiales bacterium]|nr:chorismate synthase [Clostridiales bacterium]